MSFCWPKTTPIATPIKSFALKTTQNHTEQEFWLYLCILELSAEKPLSSLIDMGHSTLADLLTCRRMCRWQIHSPPIGGKHDRTLL